MRWRIAGTSTFDSSKRKAATMCSFSRALWLSKNRRACVKWSSKVWLRRRSLGASMKDMETAFITRVGLLCRSSAFCISRALMTVASMPA